jgi:hypothetical protein
MIRFDTYAIGRVGGLDIKFDANGRPDAASITAYEDHRNAERECKPPICTDDLTRALRSNGLAIDFDQFYNGGASWPFENRSPSSVNTVLDDLNARLLYLSANPHGEASLIFVEHQGYRLSDPVDEMLFTLGRIKRAS